MPSRLRGRSVTIARRLALLTTLVVSAPVTPPGADAQPAGKVARVGFLGNVPPSVFEGFRLAMRDLGYQEGRNLVIERRAADANEERLADLAAELAQLKVDVIIAPGPVSLRAARGATSTIPIVTVGGNDPVEEGWAATLARPGRNVTGFSVGAATRSELGGKWLELLKEGKPSLRRVAVLYDANMVDPAHDLKALEAPVRLLGLRLDLLPARGPDDLSGAVATAVKKRAGALVVWTTPMLHVHQRAIVDLAAKHRLPSIALFADFAEMGGLMAYGPDLGALFRRAAGYTDRILKGANPAEMPVERPARPELTLNVKTAMILRLTLPPTLILRADRVIE
jgi:putative tryptophan/tyrosine transport system substrate-binding protein